MGYAGKLLRVNLSTGEIKTEQLDFALSRMFLGAEVWQARYFTMKLTPR